MNPNQSNKKSVVQYHFPLREYSLVPDSQCPWAASLRLRWACCLRRCSSPWQRYEARKKTLRLRFRSHWRRKYFKISHTVATMLKDEGGTTNLTISLSYVNLNRSIHLIVLAVRIYRWQLVKNPKSGIGKNQAETSRAKARKVPVTSLSTDQHRQRLLS